jgi:endonuclease/exonuclease/phosphatase family metal-dependent hydrolase
MGDLNASHVEPMHTLLLQAGWDDGGHHEPTFHAFTGRAHVRLDHLLVPRDTHRILRHHVVQRSRGIVHASDHHPIVVEIAPRE